ncbi:MAG: hypothetical protein Q4C49_09505 [Bacillota bacterium]|nr:hypothetical protein [Bacillota bacterium]
MRIAIYEDHLEDIEHLKRLIKKLMDKKNMEYTISVIASSEE